MKTILIVLLIAIYLEQSEEQECKQVRVQPNFDLDLWASKRWYIQQQMAVKYLPVEQNNCVYAEYTPLAKKTFWGFDVKVHNFAYDRTADKIYDSGDLIYAHLTNTPGKLNVGPWFLPEWDGVTTGPYWVLYHNEDKGLGVIIGGQPYVYTPQGCRTGTGVNGSGLWIVTRQQQRDQNNIDVARQIIQQQGIDLSVLNDVDQTNCNF